MELFKQEDDGVSTTSTDHNHQQQQKQQELETLTASSVANLMRQQDADLLESHHALAVNDEPPEVSTRLPEQQQEAMPVMMRDMSSFDGGLLGEGGAGDSMLSYGPASQLLRSPSGEGVSDGSTSLHSGPHTRRPTLSGQIFLTETTAEETTTTSSTQQQQSAADAGSTTTDTVKDDVLLHRRSESMDRRISEAAQFAAVVGATEVAADIHIIEDHDDDESDEDDVPKIAEDATSHADARSVGSTLGLSVGDASFHSTGATSGTGKAVLTETSRSKTSSCSLAVLTGTIVGRPHKPITTKRGFLDKLPGIEGEGDQPTFIYKGIHSNPPEIVRSGMQRGNYAQLHRKAWLEVSDKYHRYGKNLRLYYRHWEKLGCPFNMFFDWLDSKGEAAGQPLPELEDCTRAELDSDIVLYITNPDVSAQYAIGVVVHTETGRGLMVDTDGDPVVTGPDGWIFVLRDNRLYGAQKIASVTGERSKQRFHHSSFFGGKAVEAAGIFITDDQGYLTQLLPHSGHYRPGEAHMQRVLFFLYHMGVDLRSFDMDLQQILHVAREEKGDDGKVEKKKKIESLCLQPAVLAACFLAHKARFIGNGIFKQIHKIKNASVTNVTEALEFIDNGGCW